FQAVPYYKNVPGGLHPGMAVYLNGTVPEVSNRFGVDFGFAKHEGFDLAFHFNPRFKESHELVINTFQSGRWGKQERYQNPFWKGEHFEVIFIVTEAEYQVGTLTEDPLGLQGDLMYVFRHRIPPQNVQFIQVAGDLELHSLNMMAAPVMVSVSY
uniref:Galectin n=1 Tax=Naja naja TaxID=35670 RepID=A0A8C6YFD2_NAJNA